MEMRYLTDESWEQAKREIEWEREELRRRGEL